MDVDSINAELNMLAAEANEAIVDSMYEDMIMDQLAAMTASYTLADDDCDGPWYWELK